MPASGTTVPPALGTNLRYFGDYVLLEEIARGGMGVVFKARQLSLNRIVATKMLLSGQFAKKEFVERFRAEARAAANLQHPHIVAIHEVGEHEGQQYYSMDYVEGPNLAQVARDQPLPGKRAAALLKTIAEAVHYAHQRGVIHRDLKPSNVLLDATDQPRVTDFGLAKFVAHGVPASAGEPSDSPELQDNANAQPAKAGTPNDLTMTGQVLGTPAYMSPEQAGGRRGEVATTSDVYSLGAVLYFLLTGRAPFAAGTLEETLRQVHENEPVSPRLLNPAVPRDLETITLKCLAKTPTGRYESAQALADDLGRFLNDETIRARPAGRTEKLWRWCRRKPAFAGALAVCVILLTTLTIGSPIALYRINRARHDAQTEATRAYAAESQANTNLHKSYLAQAEALRASSKAGRRTDALEAIAKAAAIQPSLELRNEAIANLAQADLRLAHLHSVPLSPNNEVFDPTFALAATWLSQTRIRVQHALSREPVVEFDVPRGNLRMLRRFSPDGRYLAFATDEDQTCVWDLMNNTMVLRGTPEAALGDFSPDSRTFAIGNLRGSISVFDLSTGQRLRQLGPGIPDHGVAFDFSGRKLACWNSASLEIRDAFTGEEIHHLENGATLSGRREENIRAAWSGDGRLLAAAEADRRINLWRVDEGRLVRVFLGHNSDIVSVALSPDGEFLASSAFDATVRFWDVLAGRMLAVTPTDVWSVAFSADGRFLGPGRQGKSNGVFEIIRPAGFQRLGPPVPEVGAYAAHTIDFSPDGRLISAAASDGVRIWDRLARRLLAMIPATSACGALFTPEGDGLFVSAAGAFTRWPIRYEEKPGTNALMIGPLESAGLTAGSWAFPVIQPRSARMAVASANRRAAIASLRDPTNWVRLEKVHPGANHIDLSPDGRFAATGTWNGRGVRIWDAHSGKVLHEHSFNDHAAVAFSSDGRWLMASGGACHALAVGAWTNWTVVRPRTVEQQVATLAFSPDGRLLARANSPTSFELIEPGTWRSLAVLQSPHPIALGWPKFSPDSTLLAAGDAALGVQIWDLRQLRAALRPMGLDWDHPAYPPASPAVTNELIARVLTERSPSLIADP